MSVLGEEPDYIDESHICAFADALAKDDLLLEEPEPSPLASPAFSTRGSTISFRPPRVRKVSAMSDFAPVNIKVKKRRRKTHASHDKRTEWLFELVRWPLLVALLTFILGEFWLYVLIRQLVNAKEWLTAWRGEKGRLRKELRGSGTYSQWKDVASKLDKFLQFDEWKREDESPFYDWKLVKKVRKSLRTFREKNDARAVMDVLETCIRNNFAAIESSRLYSETFFGSKDLIEAYIDEVERSIKYIRTTSQLTNDEKRRFFKSANINFGASALCLSGGATFAYYHFGVVRAFLDAKLLPRVLSGTSAGGLVAALVCTRTEDELREILRPELASRITACEESFAVWFQRFRKTGARFDSIQWAIKCSWFTRGSLTFREAYMRTGRILNISVIPADRHSPTKLLNYMTAPDCIIWSALLASAAVPGILNPVVLMQKTQHGTAVPWNWGSRFKDGSLRSDVPVEALNLYFNVTHAIVSQANPHVHLFFFAPRGSAGRPTAHSKGKGWRGNFLLSAAEQWLKLELTKNFRFIRDLELLPQLVGTDWSSVFLQKFNGAVTIWPKTRFLDWVHILSDPDASELGRMMRVGQLVTWPKLHMIENRFRLEKEILRGRQEVRRSMRPNSRDRSAPLPENVHPTVSGSAVAPPKDDDAKSPPPLVTSEGGRAGDAEPTRGDDSPLPADSDAEEAFKNRDSRFFKPEHQHHEHRHSPRHTTTRKTNVSEAGSRSPMSQSHSPTHTLLERIRRSSLSFPRLRRGHQSSIALGSQTRRGDVRAVWPTMGDADAPGEPREDEDAWSSDTSSDDSDLRASWTTNGECSPSSLSLARVDEQREFQST